MRMLSNLKSKIRRVLDYDPCYMLFVRFGFILPKCVIDVCNLRINLCNNIM
jgi:hypothetical protein